MKIAHIFAVFWLSLVVGGGQVDDADSADITYLGSDHRVWLDLEIETLKELIAATYLTEYVHS